MDNLTVTGPGGGATPVQSSVCRASQRSFGWLRLTAVALALTALGAPAAQAGVEFVTRVGECTNKVDQPGDGKDLFIIAGPDVQFEVFGNSVDLSNPTTGFRISSTSSFSARIVSQRGGFDNLGRGCGNTGSAVVEVDTPIDLSGQIQRHLFFKMPGGDESSLPITIRPLPAITAAWLSQQSDISCIVKTGTFERLDQNRLLRIQLPPGHQQDQTTCNQNRLVAVVNPSSIGEVDIDRTLKYTATGQPGFAPFNQPLAHASTSNANVHFNLSVSGIRQLNAASNSSIVISSPNPSRTATLRLDVAPGISNGFTQTAQCRNLQTGDMVTVGDLLQCELRLSIPPGNGQLITFEAQDRLCVAAGAPSVTYSDRSGIGTTTLTGRGNIFEVPLRVAGGAMSTGQPCATETGTQHTLKFWVGARDIESGADFTQDSFRIRRAN